MVKPRSRLLKSGLVLAISFASEVACSRSSQSAFPVSPTQPPPAVITELRAIYEHAPDWGTRHGFFGCEDKMMRYLEANPGDLDTLIQYVGCHSSTNDSFDNTLTYALLNSLIDADQDDRLRVFLSLIPVEEDNPDGVLIEFAVVRPWSKRPVDGILVLADALDRATKPEVRQSLTKAIRRAFATELRTWDTDAEAIEICRSISGRKLHFKVNLAYVHSYRSQAFDSGTSNGSVPPLFIPKDGPDSVEASGQ